MVARQTPITAAGEGGRRSRIAERMGTSATDRPVMNPALEALVYCRPTVCRA